MTTKRKRRVVSVTLSEQAVELLALIVDGSRALRDRDGQRSRRAQPARRGKGAALAAGQRPGSDQMSADRNCRTCGGLGCDGDGRMACANCGMPRNPPLQTINHGDPDVTQVAAALADACHAGGLSDGYYRAADDALRRLADRLHRGQR